jgi:hypothetical protein
MIFLAMASRINVGCGERPNKEQAMSKALPSNRVASGSNTFGIWANRSMDDMGALGQSKARTGAVAGNNIIL